MSEIKLKTYYPRIDGRKFKMIEAIPEIDGALGAYMKSDDVEAAIQQVKIDVVRFAVDKAADAFRCKSCSFTSREMLAREIIEQLKEQPND